MNKHVIIATILFTFFCIGECYSDVITKANTKKVFLTFDACETSTPSYFDEKILSYLVSEKIPFTIFISGKFALRNKVRIKEVSRLNFIEIENHSMNHNNHMEKMKKSEVINEVKENEILLKTITGKTTKYFRFPAGNYDNATLKNVESLGYKVVHWTFPSGDPDKKITDKHLTEWVVSKTKPGDILIFHINGRGYNTHKALPSIVEKLKKKGITFAKLEDEF